MANAKSRYSRVGRLAIGDPPAPYYARRFLPQPASIAKASLVTVGAVDRMDLIATRTLGDPLAAWRVADANAAMDPSDLSAVPGRVLIVPSSKP